VAEARTPNKRHDLRNKPAMVRESPLKYSVAIMKDEVLLPENLCVFRPLTDICRTGFLCAQPLGKEIFPFDNNVRALGVL